MSQMATRPATCAVRIVCWKAAASAAAPTEITSVSRTTSAPWTGIARSAAKASAAASGTGPPAAVSASAETLVLDGRFDRVEMGDYAHLVMVDGKGEERSFFVSGDPSFDPFLEAPEKYRGVGPRIVRAPVKEMTFLGGRFRPVMGQPGDDGPVGDWWVYEEKGTTFSPEVQAHIQRTPRRPAAMRTSICVADPKARA